MLNQYNFSECTFQSTWFKARKGTPSFSFLPVYCLHVTESPPCWLTKTIDLSLASFVRSPTIVPFHHCYGCLEGLLANHVYLRKRKRTFPLENHVICGKTKEDLFSLFTQRDNLDQDPFALLSHVSGNWCVPSWIVYYDVVIYNVLYRRLSHMQADDPRILDHLIL